MATAKTPKYEPPQPDGFDVTCIIGRVAFGFGERTAYEAALTLIGQHGTDGTFTFPAPHGTTYVTIETATDTETDA